MKFQRSATLSDAEAALTKARASPLFALLLQAIDQSQQPGKKAALQALGREIDGQWDEFAKLLHRHRVTRRVLGALTEAECKVPTGLAQVARAEGVRALEQVSQAHEIQQSLEANGIRSMVLKGTVLSQYLYGDPAIRESKDIDIVVERDYFESALQLILTRHQYRCVYEPPVNTDRFGVWMRFNKDIKLMSPNGLQIELHHRLTVIKELLPTIGVDHAVLPVSIGPAIFHQLDRSSLFVYLCVHGSAGRWHRLTWLADIRAMLLSSGEAEMTGWYRDGERHGVGRCVLAAMILCHIVWAQTLPEPIVKAARSDPKVARIVNHGIAMMLDNDYVPAKAVGPGLTGNALLLRDERAYRIAVLKDLMVDPTQIGQVALPYRLRYLYVPLRLGLWVKRRIARLIG